MEGYLDKERIWQHVSNIKAINFHGKPVPEGIYNYIDAQIAYINKMVGTRCLNGVYSSESSKGREAVLEIRGVDDDPAARPYGWVMMASCVYRRYNDAANPGEEVPFREMYMHNADGDMETLLDIFMPNGHKVVVHAWSDG